MARDPKTVAPDTSALDAAALMAHHDIGSVPIVANGRFVGIVTDRDLVVRVLAAREDPSTVRVEDVGTTRDVVTATPGTSLPDAMALMAEHRVKRLPVLRGEELVGMVSMGDVANTSASMRSVGETVAEIFSSPATTAVKDDGPDAGTPARVAEARDGR